MPTTPEHWTLRARPDIVASHTNGGWDATSLWTYGEKAVRVRIAIDHSYAWQSVLTVELLTPQGWRELHRLDPSQSASQGHHSMHRPFPTPALRVAVSKDEAHLLYIATLLLDTLKETT